MFLRIIRADPEIRIILSHIHILAEINQIGSHSLVTYIQFYIVIKNVRPRLIGIIKPDMLLRGRHLIKPLPACRAFLLISRRNHGIEIHLADVSLGMIHIAQPQSYQSRMTHTAQVVVSPCLHPVLRPEIRIGKPVNPQGKGLPLCADRKTFSRNNDAL